MPICSRLKGHLAGAGDLDGALLAGTPLHEVAAAARLVDQREAVERAHDAPIARVHHPLRRVALPCAHAAHGIRQSLRESNMLVVLLTWDQFM